MRRQDGAGADHPPVRFGHDNLPALAQDGCFQFFQLLPVAGLQDEIFLDPVAVEIDKGLPVGGPVEAGRDAHQNIVNRITAMIVPTTGITTVSAPTAP